MPNTCCKAKIVFFLLCFEQNLEVSCIKCSDNNIRYIMFLIVEKAVYIAKHLYSKAHEYSQRNCESCKTKDKKVFVICIVITIISRIISKSALFQSPLYRHCYSLISDRGAY